MFCVAMVVAGWFYNTSINSSGIKKVTPSPNVTTSDEFPTLQVLNHPLIQHKLSLMRDVKTSTKQFRSLLTEISLLMGYEITRNLPLTEKSIETPMQTTVANVIKGKKVAVVPILRAGTGMAEGLLELMPSARVGNIGLYRNEETKQPVEYLVKLPSAKGRRFIVVDPMLATGNSAAYAIDIVKRHGVPSENIIFMALVVAPEGMAVFEKAHPDIPVYAASLDEGINENAYIMPGLGDAGDRLYGTK